MPAAAGTCCIRSTPRKSYIEQQFDGPPGPFIAASDNVRAVAEQIDPWVPGGLFAMGTDGFGRSETRANLRRHFEVDAECIAVAALYRLAEMGQFDRTKWPRRSRNWESIRRRSIRCLRRAKPPARLRRRRLNTVFTRTDISSGFMF